MERRGVRGEAEWQTLTSELHALKRKLHSKSEALLIISKDLDATQRERDQYKLMAEKLRVRCQAYKRQFSDYPLTKDQATLIQMLKDTKNQKIAHQKQSEVLQQKLTEALGDVKLLRERFARQRVGDEGVGPRHFPAHEREELVTELEEARQQAEQYRQELNISSDQLAEVVGEKEELSGRCERLNRELNFMLNGDKKRIIDIDALCMENKYLQERVKQCQEEKNSLHAQMGKMKALLNARKAPTADIKPGKIRSSGLVISPKQVKEILMSRAGLPSSAETVSDLQSIAAALLETVNDKNLALHHLRNTNKILGKRVAELEMKLKTLEVAGLWTFADQTQRSSTYALTTNVATSNLSPMTEKENEFFSTLGSRLTKLTDTCEKSFKEHRLVSFTPESSSSTSDVAGLSDERDCDVTKDLNTSVDSTLNFEVATDVSESSNGDCDVSGDIAEDCKMDFGDSIDNSDVTGKECDVVASGDITNEIVMEALDMKIGTGDITEIDSNALCAGDVTNDSRRNGDVTETDSNVLGTGDVTYESIKNDGVTETDSNVLGTGDVTNDCKGSDDVTETDSNVLGTGDVTNKSIGNGRVTEISSDVPVVGDVTNESGGREGIHIKISDATETDCDVVNDPDDLKSDCEIQGNKTIIETS